jgi:hypothetical protein
MTPESRFAITGTLACVLLMSTEGIAQAPKAPAPNAGRLAAAHQVLEAGGTVETIVAAMQANLPAQRMANPQIPAEFWTRFQARLVDQVPQLIDSIAVLYAAKFTQQELDALLEFYRSSTGRRLRELQPVLVTESSAIGQRWGMRIGAEIGASLQQPR